MREAHGSNIRRMLALIIASALILLPATLLTGCSGGGDTGGSPADTETAGEDAAEDQDSGDEESPSITEIGEFTTTDLQKNEVTQEYFAGAELTMINFWGTYCSPCIQEMPEIEELYQSYGGRLQVLGVCIDVVETEIERDAYREALNIEKDTGVTYPSVLMAGGLRDFANTLQYIPSTVFVDSEGTVVSETIIGADMDRYKEIAKEHLGEPGV